MTDEYGHISDLAVDSQGQAWLATSGSGLILFTPDQEPTVFTAENSGLPYDHVEGLLLEEQRGVWIGTEPALSLLAPDGRWTHYTTDNSGLLDGGADVLAFDLQGRLWIGNKRGVRVFTQPTP